MLHAQRTNLQMSLINTPLASTIIGSKLHRNSTSKSCIIPKTGPKWRFEEIKSNDPFVTCFSTTELKEIK